MKAKMISSCTYESRTIKPDDKAIKYK